jgi:putative endonuclease
MSYFVYIVTCADNTLYTGITINLDKRVQQHNGLKKGGARYTMHRRPVVLSYFEKCLSRSEAQIREYAMKQLSHEQKLKLCSLGVNKLNEFSNIAILKA